jgi:hypothetical protein
MEGKMKQIKIKSCGNCPYCIENNHQKNLYFCLRTNLVLDLHTIPDDCTLPDMKIPIGQYEYTVRDAVTGEGTGGLTFEDAFFAALRVCKGYFPTVKVDKEGLITFEIYYGKVLATIRRV